MSNRAEIERVREAVDLVALISEYVPLQPKGREWVGVCPFHDDHKPSFNVVTHKTHAFYKCFSCGVSGDCFAFVQHYHKKDFGEALRFLAERVGIELTNQRDDGSISSRRKIRSAMEWAMKLYREALTTTPEGSEALKVLNDRGFTEASIDVFSLGVSPDAWDFLSSRIRQSEDRTSICAEAGLVKKHASTGRLYDTFRHRIMFPIMDEAGSPIAFGGRRLVEEDEPKYINSPETELFHKSKTLYGYQQARSAVQSANQVVVVEGYTDVIACHQSGFTNVVATLGTALTKEHAATLARICDEVILVFDGDDAGQRAADRAIELFFTREIDVHICVLPEGRDPAELAKEPDRLRSCFDTAIDAITFKMDRLEGSLQDTTSLSGRAKRIESMLDELVRLGITSISGVRKRLMYERVANVLKISMKEVESHLGSRRTVGNRQTTVEVHEMQHTPPSNISKARRLAEHEFLAVLLYDPMESSAALREEKVQITPADFIDPSAAVIAARCLPRLYAGTPYSMQELLDELGEQSSILASTLFFIGQRLCEMSGSVMLAVHTTKKAFLQVIEDKAIADKVDEVHSLTDPNELAEEAQKTLETIRRQKLARSVL